MRPRPASSIAADAQELKDASPIRRLICGSMHLERFSNPCMLFTTPFAMRCDVQVETKRVQEELAATEFDGYDEDETVRGKGK